MKTTHLLIFTIFINLRSSYCEEDLLDKYVSHVGSVNRVDSSPSDSKKHNLLYQRIRRSSLKFRVEKQTNNTLEQSLQLSEEENIRTNHKRTKRFISYPIKPIVSNGIDVNAQSTQRRRHGGSAKKISSNFSPDLKPHLDRMHSEVTSNDLDDNVDSFGEFDRKSFRKKREVLFSDWNQWTHSAVLDQKGDIVLRWQPRHQEIAFRVEAKTRGYIGVGFSPNGGMEGADMVVGWIDDKNGKPYLVDYHGSKDKSSEPVKDEIDNYMLMSGQQNDTHTVLEFRRAMDTCDPEDYVLSADTVRVIWAAHHRDPHQNLGLVFHEENRGSQSLHLLGPSPVSQVNNIPVAHWDVTLKNFAVKDDMDTIYWCKIFKAPVLQQKHHIIGFEPLIGKNHSKFVHHMLLHECILDSSTDFRKWESFASESGRPCYEEAAFEWEKCLTPVVAWAIGSKGEDFPPHVGIPLNNKRVSFYRLEVHFDNPSMKRAVGTSGLRIKYTNSLRENDGGILVTGIALSPLHIIPPFQKSYKSAGYCSTGCTEHMFPKDGINVVSVLLHSHLAGIKLKLRHIRGKQELAPIAQDNHYDFNYQQSRLLSQEIKILPGDALVTECTYNTYKRKVPTFGGYSTQQEMCLAFVLHYPKTELAGCYSMPPVNYFFDILGVKKFYDKSMMDVEKIILQGGNSETSTAPSTSTTPLFPYKPGDEYSAEANQRAVQALKNAKEYTIESDPNTASNNILEQLIIEEPLEFRNKTFMSHLDVLPYYEQVFTQKMEEYFYTGLHLTFCRKEDDTLAMKEKVEMLPEFTPYLSNDTKIQCSYKLRHTDQQTNSAYGLQPTIITLFLILCSICLH